MTVREKLEEAIRNGPELKGCSFVKENVLPIYGYTDCNNIGCSICCLLSAISAEKEIENEDWSKVPVDTKVLVLDYKGDWHKMYFAEYKDGQVWTFADGRTSWSSDNTLIAWESVKLAEENSKNDS